MSFEDIFIVIVLYKSNLETSVTIKTIGESLGVNSTIDIFVYDNSPNKQYLDENFIYQNFNVQYVHDSLNLGLSRAYNSALELAKKNKKSWLLLLDQDTYFTKEYIDKISILDKQYLKHDTVAIIPKVNNLNNNQVISPGKMFLGGICRPLIIEEGIVNSKITGINSGTLLSIAYLNEINGFNENYTLDMLDHWYFKKIFDDKRNVLLLGATIKQDLSVIQDFEANVSCLRYKQMLEAENLFMKEEGYLNYFVFKLRLISRFFKQLKFKNKVYFQLTLKNVFNF